MASLTRLVIAKEPSFCNCSFRSTQSQSSWQPKEEDTVNVQTVYTAKWQAVERSIIVGDSTASELEVLKSYDLYVRLNFHDQHERAHIDRLLGRLERLEGTEEELTGRDIRRIHHNGLVITDALHLQKVHLQLLQKLRENTYITENKE